MDAYALLKYCSFIVKRMMKMVYDSSFIIGYKIIFIMLIGILNRFTSDSIQFIISQNNTIS